jgi:phosphoribosylformimino-5-aminoimidazole carboxamide ribotide isomerase
MDIIPVIDIRNGVAVRAVAGRRAEYRPLVSPLARTSAPLDVAQGLMSLAAFRALYIADLDAIEGRGDNLAAVREMARRFPHARLWIDAGFRRADDAGGWLAVETVEAVFGSETIESPAVLESLSERAILSLDYRGDVLLGPDGMVSASALWPQSVIVMTLDRVGAGSGPDLDRLKDVRRVAGNRALIAAGGVRGMDDLVALKKAGVEGALVATALHEGRVAAGDLELL